MRAAAPVQVALCRFGAWRVAVSSVALASLIAIALWLMQTMPPPSMGVVAGAVVVAMAVIGLGWHLLRTPRTSLRWDGAAWHLGPLGTAGDEPASGEVDVAIDLGAWMLLRFAPEAPSHGPSITWLPVQRQGLEPQWHALRCAVYSPRPPPAVAPKVDH